MVKENEDVSPRKDPEGKVDEKLTLTTQIKKKIVPLSCHELPSILKGVDSHVAWIEEHDIICYIHRSALGAFESMKGFVQSLLDNPPKELMDEDDAGDLLEGEPIESSQEEKLFRLNFGSIALKLNIAAMNVYVGNIREAKKHSEFLDKILAETDFLKGIKIGQQKAVMYYTEAMHWAIKQAEVLQSHKTPAAEDVTSGSEEISTFNGKRDDLRNYREAEAVQEYFRASLAGALMMSEEMVVEMYERASELDPDEPVWYHNTYKKLRRIRRNVKRQATNTLEKPCDRERLACEMAFNLDPENYSSMRDMALMIKETLWTWDSDESVWDENQKEYLRCVDLFRESIRLAIEKGEKGFVCKTKIYLGEVLLFGKGKLLNQLEGKTLFEECERDFPNSSVVLHKLAKLYHRGAHETRKFRNSELAKVCFERALANGRQNFACLMDYVKLMKIEACRQRVPFRRQRMYKELLDTIDKSLEVIKRDYQVAKLLALQGLIIWSFNPDKTPNSKIVAAKIWVDAFKGYPDHADNICETIKKPPFLIDWKPIYIPVNELSRKLEELAIQNKDILGDEEMACLISSFIRKLKEASP